MRAFLGIALLSGWLVDAVPASQRGPSGAPFPSARVVDDRYITARGGLEKIRAVRTMVLRGPPRPNGRPGRFMARARPNYFLVGEPAPTRDFAEGFDGSSWEFYSNPGLVIRTTGEPAAASRHTSYFDDPLVSSLEPGWKVVVTGSEPIGERPAWRLRTTFPDGFQADYFVDKATWLVIANRKVAPIHAFGEAIRTETRVSDYRDINGALFPMQFSEYVIATGKPVDGEVAPAWASVEVNVTLPLNYFSPPPEPETALARTLNAIYANRMIPADAMRWYRDLRTNPATSGLEVERGVAAVGYQCLKNGAIAAAVLLLEANLLEYPTAAAHFGLGRAYRAAGRERDALAKFKEALALDPTYQQAKDALAAPAPRRAAREGAR
ncbi:MAG: tetratricopeptide repeat protein [Gemmatimonadales bacterium]|nr:tetratricopeptide repeat protein [Gemmatimonadales bacterium]